MTIRSRLLLLLVPSMTIFLVLISLLFYFHWSSGILNGYHAWVIILIVSFIALLFVILMAYLIADTIAKPFRQLNQAALEIAAGDYEANIKVEGPKEIVELAQTLNTMSECLVEHLSRLRESSLIKERMYGEYECALLLEHYMLPKVIEDFESPSLRVLLISVPLSPLQKGLFFKIQDSPTTIDFSLLEAKEQGFAGLFHLNQLALCPKDELKDQPLIDCHLNWKEGLLHYRHETLFPPLVWSIKAQQFIKGSQDEIPLRNRDMIFLYNSSLIEHFEKEAAIEAWFGKVLRHFAEDGLDTIQTMLTNELTFLAKKQHTKRNFKIISMQLDYAFSSH